MGVYEPLKKHLESLPGKEWSVDFAEIERILSRKLPDSAYDYRPWWGNQRQGNHSQAKAWREAGWKIREVDLERRSVCFERVRPDLPTECGTKTEFDALFEKARQISGIEDRDLLMKAGIEALINREITDFVASLGGSMPDAEAAPRRRFE